MAAVISRRALVGASFCICFDCSAKTPVGGCVIEQQEYEVLGVVTLPNGVAKGVGARRTIPNTPPKPQLTDTSSDYALDRSLAKNALVPLASIFQIRPEFAYADFRNTAYRNSLALIWRPVKKLNEDGVVVLDLPTLTQLLSEKTFGVLLGILAHEFGHGRQLQSGWSQRFRARDEREARQADELHADYLAGYPIRFIEETRYADQLDINDIINWWGSNGGTSHGTGQQRIDALSGGYKYAQYNKFDRSIVKAEKFGADLVFSLLR